MVTIRHADGGEAAEACLELARPMQAFNDDGLETMAEELPTLETVVAFEGETLVGFASVTDHGPKVCELRWMAVRETHRNQGVGTRLLDRVCERMVADGGRLLTVKTLADTVSFEPYVRTRAFYENRGFLHVETVDPYPDWGPGNPCAIYVKPLSSGASE